jgi:hypothetical protein
MQPTDAFEQNENMNSKSFHLFSKYPFLKINDYNNSGIKLDKKINFIKNY